MRLPRNWVSQPLTPGAELQLPPGVTRHLAQVLRMKPGEEIILFNGEDGRDYRATLLQVDRKQLTAHIEAAGPIEELPRLCIELALGISRGERMDLALQKSVELGVTRITPLITERTQIRLSAQRQEKRMQHWQKIIISACEQSGRRRLPVLESVEPLDHWLSQQKPGILFMDPDAQKTLAQVDPPGETLCFLSGPEGGFSEREKRLAEEIGCMGIRLGPRILRTETAPLAAIAAAQMLWGDFL